MLSEIQQQQIKERGIEQQEVVRQLEDFKKGFPFMRIERAAKIDDGIIRLSEEQINDYINNFSLNREGYQMVKMVPASGAATRMFKALYEYLADGKSNKEVENFLAKKQNFAFYQELKSKVSEENNREWISKLLNEDGLGYGSLPKGLLAFHSYGEESRTPLEEHLFEAAQYAQDGEKAYLHFTVSPEHRSRFEALVSKVVGKFEKRFGIQYIISFSEQKSSTDTVAVNKDNSLFLEDGKILFRPAGHGALLENLNDLEGDIIFIKNVDNVVPEKYSESTIAYKKALMGILLGIINRNKEVFASLKGDIKIEQLNSALKYLGDFLGYIPEEGFSALSIKEQVERIGRILDRPTRVCGVVKNTGEPGGGPFWVKGQNGAITLQLVESAQVDAGDVLQQEIFQGSTHFNPVDLVCYPKNMKGEELDLLRYRDMEAGFITEKTKDGQSLKAMELPGLWNGSMSDWNTIFVEVPLETFNPVKTVNDLLRPMHQ